MAFQGIYIADMNDQEHWAYMEHCDRLTGLLAKAIDHIMHHLFQGSCQNPQDWEALFKAVSQAVFMKEYLTMYCSNIVGVAEDFLTQIEAWQQEVQTKLN